MKIVGKAKLKLVAAKGKGKGYMIFICWNAFGNATSTEKTEGEISVQGETLVDYQEKKNIFGADSEKKRACGGYSSYSRLLCKCLVSFSAQHSVMPY